MGSSRDEAISHAVASARASDIFILAVGAAWDSDGENREQHSTSPLTKMPLQGLYLRLAGPSY